MFIYNLEFHHFRNLQRTSISLDPNVVLLRGDNGQGKTNILEALYLCTTGRSFRRATSSQMVQFEQTTARLTAQFQRQGVCHDVEVLLHAKGRSIRLDGRLLKRTSNLLNLLNVVAFFPEDLHLIKGSPEQRRSFLDRLVANQEPIYVDAAIRYQRVLRQRNHLLRSSHKIDKTLLETYNAQIIELGSGIHIMRAKALQGLIPGARAILQSILGHQHVMDAKLNTGLPTENFPMEEKYYREKFKQALNSCEERDLLRGSTSVGPHRADLDLILEKRSAKMYASQGQQRAMVLALKFAEVALLEKKLGCRPILLLDDVSAELDLRSNRRLFKLIEQDQGQSWISTTGSVPIPGLRSAQQWEVHDGSLRHGVIANTQDSTIISAQ